MSFWVGKRIRVSTVRDMTPMKPHIVLRSADEWCNPVFVLHLWPIIGLDVWYGSLQRKSICEDCKVLYRAEGMCFRCHARPCHCDPEVTDD